MKLNARLSPLDLNWALHSVLPPLDFVLPGLLPGGLGLMVAPGGTGKSYLALDIAMSIAIGRSIAGGLFPATQPGKVVYLAGEENDRLLAERLRSILDITERAQIELQNLVLLPMSGENCLLLSKGQPTDLLDELEKLSQGARLIIIDPIRRLHDGEENDSATMTQLVIALESLAKKTSAAVIGIHHANRASAGDTSSQNASRGSSALVDGARWQINLSKMDVKTADGMAVSEHDRPLYVALDFAKGNYLPSTSRQWLIRQPGGALKLTDLAKSQPKNKNLGGARLIP
jgi:hypothetical protein